jgi:hypothetical protein
MIYFYEIWKFYKIWNRSHPIFYFYCIFSHFRADFTFIRDSLILNGLNTSFSFNLTFNYVCIQIWAKRKEKKWKRSNCNIKTSRKRRKIDIVHEQFHLYCTNQNYKLQYTFDIYIYRIYAYLDLICSLSRRGIDWILYFLAWFYSQLKDWILFCI